MKNRAARNLQLVFAGILTMSLLTTSCGRASDSYRVDQLEEVQESTSEEQEAAEETAADSSQVSASPAPAGETASAADQSGEMEIEVEANSEASSAAEKKLPVSQKYSFKQSWEYADYSEIHTDPVTLWFSQEKDRKNVIVAVNAGHGCSGGESAQTYCHPDKSAKVTGGSTSAGSTMATAINGGMTFNDGTREADAVLQLARLVRQELLDGGYDVLMIRDNEDTQLDNIARTVFANNCADCHISLHYDSTGSDKGFFYIRVPDNADYKAMEPVHSHWEKHDELGETLLEAVRQRGDVPVFSGGSMAIDLTQTSYSTVPSVDLEIGDAASDHSEMAQKPVAEGIAAGIDSYFRKNPVKDGGAFERLVNAGGSTAAQDDASDGDGQTENADGAKE